MEPSVQYFRDQLSSLSTEDILERLANAELRAEARQAAKWILAQRGIAGSELDAGLVEAANAPFRKSGITNVCDHCSGSTVLASVAIGMLRFCSEQCRDTSVWLSIATRFSSQELDTRTKAIRQGKCPVCHQHRGEVESRWSSSIVSAVFVSWRSSKWRISCKRCGRIDSALAALSNVLMGWWSLHGLFITPYYVMANLLECAMPTRHPQPSTRLVLQAKLELAQQLGNEAYDLEVCSRTARV
jgi:hypothetical protein